MRTAAALLMLAWLAAHAPGADRSMSLDAPPLAGSAQDRARTAAAMIAPTAAHLAGRMRLADAIAALCAAGNATALDVGVDGDRQAVIAQADGSYWSAVAAVCAAFALAPLPGTQHEHAQPDGAVALEYGALVLADADADADVDHDGPAQIIPLGGLAAMVSDCHVASARGEPCRIGICASLRLEPHVPATIVGECGIRLISATDQSGHAIPLPPPLPPYDDSEAPIPHDLALELEAASAPSTVQIKAVVLLSLVVPWHITTEIACGDTTAIACGGSTFRLILNKSGPTGATGSLSLNYPLASLVDEPSLTLTRDGMTLEMNGTLHTRQNGIDCHIVEYAQLDAQPYQCAVSGVAMLGAPLELPIRMRVPLDGLSRAWTPPAAARMFVPTRVQWSAGRRSLADALASFASVHQHIGLRYDVDAQQARELPAFDGTCMQGLLVLCHAFGLAPTDRKPGDTSAPPMGGMRDAGGVLRFGGNALRLMPADHPLRASACGPLLIQDEAVSCSRLRSLAGTLLHVDATMRLWLEPHLRAIRLCRAEFDTLGSDDGGAALCVTDLRPAAEDADAVSRPLWRVFNQSPPDLDAAVRTDLLSVAIERLAPTARTTVIGGSLIFTMDRRDHQQVVLVAGEPITIAGFGIASGSTVELVDQASATRGRLDGTGVLIKDMDGVDPSRLHLISPSGRYCVCTGTAAADYARRLLRRFPVSEPGPYTLVIDSSQPTDIVRIPFTHEIAVPPP